MEAGGVAGGEAGTCSGTMRGAQHVQDLQPGKDEAQEDGNGLLSSLHPPGSPRKGEKGELKANQGFLS